MELGARARHTAVDPAAAMKTGDWSTPISAMNVRSSGFQSRSTGRPCVYASFCVD